jgi:hypothetical protein|tara:strand:+ start:538 stop:741 length:204 start_codon:yes stop_codon:yes gene_type:complete
MSIDIWRLTSIKLLNEVYNGFKEKGRMQNVTLQKLVNRAMWLYLNDENFANQIKETQELKENYKNGY